MWKTKWKWEVAPHLSDTDEEVEGERDVFQVGEMLVRGGRYMNPLGTECYVTAGIKVMRGEQLCMHCIGCRVLAMENKQWWQNGRMG